MWCQCDGTQACSPLCWWLRFLDGWATAWQPDAARPSRWNSGIRRSGIGTPILKLYVSTLKLNKHAPSAQQRKERRLTLLQKE